MAPSLATLLLSAGLATAQFVKPPSCLKTKEGHAGVNVRYKEVPTGICEQNPDVKSFSGYADVAENQHIFWWFFEAREVDPATAPLTIWINGGPGSSSMIGLWQELGPCGVDYDGNVYDNPYSWNKASNLIFIDQPTTTGFSYSIPVPGAEDADGNFVLLPNATCPDYVDQSTCGTYNIDDTSLTANSTPAAAPNFYLTLQGFTGAFPEYSSNGVYFASESYGGHYVPVFSRYILEQNKLNAPGTANIDLRAVLIGNGWFDPILQYAAYYNFTSVYSDQPHKGGNDYGINYNESVDKHVYDQMYGQGNCLDKLLDCASYPYANYTSDGEGNEVCAEADEYCYSEVEYVFDETFLRDEYDIRYLTPDPFPYAFYVDYLNTPEVQAAIGAYTNFSEGSSVTSSAFAVTGDDGREIGVTDAVEYLIDEGLDVVIYFGDSDYICNWFGGEAFVQGLSNIPEYTNGSAGFVNITTSDGIVHGEVKSAGKFSFVRIYQSGHEVPFYQPLVSLEMLDRVLNGVDIATGTVPVTIDYVTDGPVLSTYSNGNSTVTSEVIPLNATYNVHTNQPNPPYNTTPVDEASLLTRYEHAILDAQKWNSRSAEGSILAARSSRTKKGRAALFGGN
jgi:carboxypeptidase C (cathepsin A)